MQASHLAQFRFESPPFMPVCKAPGIQYLLTMLVFACAFMHGLEVVWKLQFFWKMNAHCCGTHFGELSFTHVLKVAQ
ncbi:hypothetical protein PR202_ga02822 [Eleusine coracana subsp. coracana]|uniref:Uncharacterized protein n=1 Tax=Eleusine coracana subsp. coracana TaxID=191504 RepID=A0AAV5BNP0_ELECO|nr:hypothetical protein PR202_ga02822 [Eleusine coracana subsp. coracana]